VCRFYLFPLFAIIFHSSSTTTPTRGINDEAHTSHPCHIFIVICVVTVAGGRSGVPVVSRLPHPHLCRQSVVHCCHRMSIHPGRHTSSRAILVVFAPRWVAASLVTFLLHQIQSTTHCRHHRTPPLLCRSQQMRRHCLLTPHSAVTVTVAAIVTFAVDIAKPSPSRCPAAAATVSVA